MSGAIMADQQRNFDRPKSSRAGDLRPLVERICRTGGAPASCRATSVLLIIAWLASGSAARAQEIDRDPWLGPDKALHFAASAGIAAGGYALGAQLWDQPAPRLISGGALALTAGIAKELYDLSGGGDPSWRDFTWDVIGTATGLLVSWLIDRLLFDAPAKPSAQALPLSMFDHRLLDLGIERLSVGRPGG